MKKSYADMDPTEEMRAIKEELSREFSTARALGEYLRKKYPMSPPRKSSRNSIEKKASSRRKAAKRLAHA